MMEDREKPIEKVDVKKGTMLSLLGAGKAVPDDYKYLRNLAMFGADSHKLPTTWFANMRARLGKLFGLKANS